MTRSYIAILGALAFSHIGCSSDRATSPTASRDSGSTLDGSPLSPDAKPDDDAAEGDANLDVSCGSACGSGCCGDSQVCCLDQHGHNPACIDGSECLSPLQPVDGGAG